MLAKGAFLGWHIDLNDLNDRKLKLYTGNPIHVANPEDSPKRWSARVKLNSTAPRGGPRYGRFLFSFGAIGTIWVLVYAGSLGDALEIAAEWLADNKMWGHITPHDKPKEELGCDCTDPFECDNHTYTESGWLDGHEWRVDELITNADLRRIHKDK